MRPSNDCVEPGRAVVFVHGMALPSCSTALLERRIAPVHRRYRFVFRSLRDDFCHNLERLSAFLGTLTEPVVDLVGHSLGGLLSVAAASRGLPLQRGRIVCLGSPLAGSAVADRIAHWRCGRYVLGSSIYEFACRRPQATWTLPQREIGIIAGNAGFGLGRLFVHFDAENDGTVAVAETCWPGAVDHIVLPVSHLGFLWSRTVAYEARHFLAHGRFSRASVVSS